jgi:hypothetical protein
MKYLLIFSLLLHPSSGIRPSANYPQVDLIQVRLAPWPINLQRVIYYTDTCYAIQFRDQSAMNSVSYKTMDLETIGQLKYFKEGLLSLKKGSDGDIAEFRNYSIKKVYKKKGDAWYILSYDGAVTNFQEAQANRMVYIINDLVANQH